MRHRNRWLDCCLIVVLVIAGWLPWASHASAEGDGWQPVDTVRIAVVGDYGDDSQVEADVAAMVRRWKPDFVVTTGDNNYPSGAAGTIDNAIGRHYHEFIAPYNGAYGRGADTNRFFPRLVTMTGTPGHARCVCHNRTWTTLNFQATSATTTLPGAGAHLRRRQRLSRAGWLVQRLDPSRLAAPAAGGLDCALEGGGDARASLLLWVARFEHATALALPGMGCKRGTFGTRSHL